MKFHGVSEPSLSSFNKPRSKTTLNFIVPILTSLTLLLTLIITLYFPDFFDRLLKPTFTPNIEYRNLEDAIRQAQNHHTKPIKEDDRLNSTTTYDEDGDGHQCDIFSGEWVRDENGPYYTNETCLTIEEHQNCMKFGRPDSDFLKWRWKPDGCELPLFDPHEFLAMMKGKSLAFVGDSVGRNHMQSLICLLSRVARPLDMSHDPTRPRDNLNISDPEDQHRRFVFTDHDFNISFFWSPYLVKTGQLNSTSIKNSFNLYLDEPDPYWPTQIRNFHYVIISAGHWFFRPAYFYLNGSLTGCLYCPEPNITRPPSPVYFSYRRAFRTALAAINAVRDFNGVTFLRTFAPAHYEGGNWNDGGDCRRRRPFMRNETGYDYSSEMYGIQMRAVRRVNGGKRKKKVRLFDATKAMLLRPDGHPSRFGHRPEEIRAAPSDCVHWCLPGPIDAWNDMLQELLRREMEYT